MKEPTCDNCPFFWETGLTEAGDQDCGCFLGCDWEPKSKLFYIVCYLPTSLQELAYKVYRIMEEIWWWQYMRKHKEEFEDE